MLAVGSRVETPAIATHLRDRSRVIGLKCPADNTVSTIKIEQDHTENINKKGTVYLTFSARKRR